MENKKNIKNLSIEEIESYMLEQNMPKFRAKQVFEWVYKDVESFYAMSNLPKNLQEALDKDFVIERAKIVKKSSSKLDDTQKYLLSFTDGNAVECVLMTYSYGKTICISTQVGCKMACTFCASTIGGLVRNLTCGEILEEVMAVSRDIGERISNIVLMGAGEPFENYEQVIKFLKLVNHEKGLNVGLRHITLSTSGVVPGIYAFAEEKMPCTLAISLHAADDTTRGLLMPVNKKYPLPELMEACRHFINKTNKRITFEYALIKGINDDRESAEKLSRLLKGMLCHVNLIPMNKVEGRDFEKSNKETVQLFKTILEKNGIEATTRRELGADIDAACGQLRRKYLENQSIE